MYLKSGKIIFLFLVTHSKRYHMQKKNVFLSSVFFLLINCSAKVFCATENSTESDQFQDQAYFSSTYKKIDKEVITPEASPYVAGGINFYLNASYILWQSSQDGLRYAMDGLPPIATSAMSNNDLMQGSIRHPNFQLSSGFKVGAGYEFDYDGWDIKFLYTWLYSNAYDSFGEAPEGQINLGFYTGNAVVLSSNQSDSSLASAITPISGSSDWKIHFNSVDLELGREYFISPRLMLRPNVGLKGTWQTQHFDISYTSIGTTTSVGPYGYVYANATEVYQPLQKQKYWGVGPRAGLNLSWMANKAFSFLGNCSISSLWGYFTTSRRDISNVSQSNGFVFLSNYTAVNSAQRIHIVNPVLETSLGFQYNYWFSEDHYRLQLAALWEQQVWFNQNHFFAIFQSIKGDLTFQGLTFNLRLDF